MLSIKLCCSCKAPSTCGNMLENDNIHCECQDCLCSDLYRMFRYIVNPGIVCILICCGKEKQMAI